MIILFRRLLSYQPHSKSCNPSPMPDQSLFVYFKLALCGGSKRPCAFLLT